MSKKVNKTAVGIFLVGALVLIIAAVIVLGSGKLFKKSVPIVMFFEGSVQGLNVGSPVVYHGVKVGEVTSIRIVFDPKAMKAQIPVYAELVQGSMQAADRSAEERMRGFQKHPELFARALVDQGLRAQLQTQSFVTGQLMVGLDFFPDRPSRVIGRDTKYIEIPTVATNLQQLQERLASLPIEELITDTKSAVESINKIVSSPKLVSALLSASQGVDEIRQLVRNLDSQLEPAATSMKNVSASLEPLAKDAAATLARANSLISKMDDAAADSPIVLHRLNQAMEEMEHAARSISTLAEYLEKQPDSLVWGKRSTKGESK
ncbi:MAG TPA: hypothetical protein DCR97_01230 [Deltaproteobacteria bacterium]|nr:hypothetical protein [Deltaproteobacteria bacterium]